MKYLAAVIGLAVLSFAASGWAQVAAPNEAGVSMGHLHLNVRDIDANKKFWRSMGGVPAKMGEMEVMKFPDVLVFLKQAEPTGGSVGTIINHVGFLVPNVPASMKQWQEAGLKTEQGTRPQQGWVYSPDNLKIEIQEDASMKSSIRMHHVHYWTAESAIPDIKAWYVKMFGAKPGKRGDNEADDVPGANLTFSKSVDATVATKDRALDHIGFEVKNLEAFCKKLEAGGQKFDRPFTKTPIPGLSIAFLTDPWGTYIELTEGLDKL